MRRNLVLLSAFAVLIGGVSYSVPAQAGLLEFFFPSLRQKEYDPTEKMIAPFAVGQEAEEKEQLESLPIDSIPLSKPHLLNSDIADWVMETTGSVMNFNTDDLAAELESRKPFFDANGHKLFYKFLHDKNMVKVIETSRYSVKSYVENTPLLLNEGVVKERYRWLFEVTIVVTYMDRNIKSYKKSKQKLITQRAMVKVQIGRIPPKNGSPGLQIEQWTGTVEPVEPPEEKR